MSCLLDLRYCRSKQGTYLEVSECFAFWHPNCSSWVRSEQGLLACTHASSDIWLQVVVEYAATFPNIKEPFTVTSSLKVIMITREKDYGTLLSIILKPKPSYKDQGIRNKQVKLRQYVTHSGLIENPPRAPQTLGA